MNKYSVFCERNVNLSTLAVRVLRFCPFTIQQAHHSNYGGYVDLLFAFLIKRLMLYKNIYNQCQRNDCNAD